MKINFTLKLWKMFGFAQSHYVEGNSVVRDCGPCGCPSEGCLQQLQGLQVDPDHGDATRNSTRVGNRL